MNPLRRLANLTRDTVGPLLKTAIDEMRRTRRVIVAEGSRPAGEPPIFVVGVHRSGTTLVRLILDSHPRIACPPESFFLLALARVLGDEKSAEGLEAMGFDEAHVLGKLRECASYFFETYTAARGKERWADKTPPYVDCLDFLDALYGPECRYVLVFRHGLDTACSLGDVTPREVAPHIEACGGDRAAGAARYWATQVEKMLRFQEAHAARCFELRYEELTADPEPTLRRLFEFLGEEWHPQVLAFHEQPHDRWIGLEDRKASQSRGFSPNVGRYRELPAEVIHRMLEEAGPALEKLGYVANTPGLAQAPTGDSSR